LTEPTFPKWRIGGDTDGPAPWKVENGSWKWRRKAARFAPRTEFGDFQLHLQFTTSGEPAEGNSQGRGNSRRHRLAVQPSTKSKSSTPSKTRPTPTAKPERFTVRIPARRNAAKASRALAGVTTSSSKTPRWEKGQLVKKRGCVTVIHNGVVVQNHQEILGAGSPMSNVPKYTPPHDPHGPITLRQDHGNPKTRFRGYSA